MKKLLISFLLVSFVLSSVAFAQDFSLDIYKKDKYLATHKDYITVKINNPLEEDWFSIGFIGPEDWIYPETSLIRIPSGGSGEIKIAVEPPRDVIPPSNPYQCFLKVKRVSTGSELEKALLIRVVQITNAIIKDLSLSCDECLEKVGISGTIYNVGSKTIDLALVFKVGDKRKTISIGELEIFEKKEFETSFPLEDMKPGNYVVEVKLVDEVGNNLYTESASFSIPTVENIFYDEQVSSTPFGSMVTLTAINEGNTVSDANLRAASPETWYSIYSGPKPTGMAIGYNFWKVSLEPGESTKISYSEIFWPTYLVIVFVVIIGVFLRWHSMAFTFTKNIVRGKKIRGGREVSISLHVKNKGKKLKKINIRDIIPSKFSVIDKFETVKPVMKKIARGVQLNWKIKDIKPFEERVLHYTIKPAVDIIRRVSLPSAVLKASQEGKTIKKRSNAVSLHPEKIKTKYVAVKVSK